MHRLQHQLTDHVKLLQKAVLIHQGEALLLKRSTDSKSRPGKWDLAGGNSEWPEIESSVFGLYRQDIAREIQEETGIAVDPNSFDLEHLVFFDTFFDFNKQIFSVICGWKYELPADFDRSQIKLSHEHSESQWLKQADLNSVDFGGEHGEFVKRMVEKSLL